MSAAKGHSRSLARVAVASAIAELADATKAETAAIDALTVATDLETSAAKVLATMTASARQAGLTLAERIKAGLPSEIEVDEGGAVAKAQAQSQLDAARTAKGVLAEELMAAKRRIEQATLAVSRAGQAVFVEHVEGLIEEGVVAVATLKRVQTDLWGADKAGGGFGVGGGFQPFPFPRHAVALLHGIPEFGLLPFQQAPILERWRAFREALKTDPDATLEAP